MYRPFDIWRTLQLHLAELFPFSFIIHHSWPLRPREKRGNLQESSILYTEREREREGRGGDREREGKRGRERDRGRERVRERGREGEGERERERGRE
ncbi:hypothetical protein J6590_096318 [Homalodisca vitripennis]|nr:hypothetical protein J6590_096318 [Homalodisca vitripennis]